MWIETDQFPEPGDGGRQRALQRLRERIEGERQHRHHVRLRRRVVVTSLSIAVLLGLSPTGPDGALQPLLGLAEAVAASPAPLEPVARHWYIRTERTEVVVVATGAHSEALQFLLAAVEETWHDMGAAPRRTTTYGSPVFFSSEDEDSFHAAGLASVYRPGRMVSETVQMGQFPFISASTQLAPAALEGALRRTVAGAADRRLETAHLLQLTADLIQLHADDPQVRAQVLRVIADIPGIVVVTSAQTVNVSFDYVDGDRPLRLVYEFDAETAHLVGESLAVLTHRAEPESVLRSARHSLPTSLGFSQS